MKNKNAAKSQYDNLDPITVLSMIPLIAPLANFVSGWPTERVCQLEAMACKYAATRSRDEMRVLAAELVAVFRKRESISHIVDQLGAAADRLAFSPSLHRAGLAYLLSWFSVSFSPLLKLPAAAPAEAGSSRS